jgi:hypothetical protein
MCGAVCVLFLLMLNSAVAEPKKWDSLSKMQKHVIKEHEVKWSSYSEDKQNGILKKTKNIVKGMQHYKKWVKKLSKKEQKDLEEKFKKMKPVAFKKYTDKLMKAKKEKKEKK